MTEPSFSTATDVKTKFTVYSDTESILYEQFLINAIYCDDLEGWGAESSLPVAHPGYWVLSDILFRLGLIANARGSHSAVLRL